MAQEQVQKQKQSTNTAEVQEADQSTTDLRDEELATDIDAILADIDEVLEENAEEFVNGFVQKGGQ